MPDPKLSPADAARLRAETYGPLIEADLRAVQVHVDCGTLSDDRLDALLGWIETWHWTGRVESEDLIAMFTSSCKLTPEQHREIKTLAARAIHARGGRYVARDQAWCSDDGVTLRGELR